MFSPPQRFYAEVLDVVQPVHSASSAGKTTGGVRVRTIQAALPSEEGTVPMRDGGVCSLVLWWRVLYLCVVEEGTQPLRDGGYYSLVLWWRVP